MTVPRPRRAIATVFAASKTLTTHIELSGAVTRCDIRLGADAAALRATRSPAVSKDANVRGVVAAAPLWDMAAVPINPFHLFNDEETVVARWDRERTNERSKQMRNEATLISHGRVRRRQRTKHFLPVP